VIVLVTETEYGRASEVFESAPVNCIATSGDEDSLAEAIATHGARYVIVGSVKYVGGLYDALPRGGVIARFGVGDDGIDKQKATTAPSAIPNTPAPQAATSIGPSGSSPWAWSSWPWSPPWSSVR